MDSFKKEAKKRDLGEYYYYILDILVILQYLPTQSHDEGEGGGSGSNTGESCDGLKVVGEKGRTRDLWY